MAEGAPRGLGFGSMLRVMRVEAALVVSRDPSAAKAFYSTRGLGRMRHIEVKDLWLKVWFKDGRVVLSKVRGDQNVADVMTKHLDRTRIKCRLLAEG